MKTYQHWIDGAEVEPASGAWLDSVDPYTGETWARIPRGNAEDAQRAVAAAHHAMHEGEWSQMTASQRGRILRRIGDLLSEPDVAKRLAEVESRDNGKILAEMHGQLAYLPEHWYYYAGLADKIEGAVLPVDKADMVAMTYREPVGVVAALTAWNSPLMFFTIKCAPALAAGCSVVLKPSEFASVSSLELAALTKRAGLPDGVINVVTGLGQEVGTALVEHRDVAKVTFTGSDVTGAKVYEAAARGMKRVSMELGGKSPNIVFEDADLDQACRRRGGWHLCARPGRCALRDPGYWCRTRFVRRSPSCLLAMARVRSNWAIRCRPTRNIGPIATPPQYQKVLDYIDVAKADGARCILGGAAGDRRPVSRASVMFVQPTIFTDVSLIGMRIAQEEVFGPMLVDHRLRHRSTKQSKSATT